MGDKKMVLEYVPIISAMIFAGLLIVSMLQFANVRKNMKIQSEQQIYTKIIEARLKIENTEAFTNMAKQSTSFEERFALVDNPEEYYTIIAFLDLLEFIFRLEKTKMIDEKLCQRWKSLAKLLMTIPKFKKIWDKTKHSHTEEFIQFIDSFENFKEEKRDLKTLSK